MPFSPKLDQWYHLAVTRNGNTYTIFINGSPKGSATDTRNIPNANAPLLIGRANEPFGGFMNGRLDEITIYNRALIPEEMEAIYTVSSEGKCKKLNIATKAVPAVKLGEFSSFEFEAAFGEPPFTWSLTDGVPPPGMDLSPEGVLSGTPEEAGEFIFNVKVVDNNGDFAEKEFAQKVLVTLPPPEIRTFKTGTTPVPGRVMTTLIIVENIGNTIATDLITVDVLDESLSLQTVSEGGNEGPSFVAWDVPDLLPGDVRVFSHQAKIDPAAPLGKNISTPTCTREDMTEIAKCLDNIEIPLLCDLACATLCLTCISLCVSNPLSCPACITRCFVCSSACTLNMLNEVRKCFKDKPGCPIPPPLRLVGPKDPNEKLVIANKYIQPDQLLVYPIHFENIGDVEALDVFITDIMDPNLDTSTLEILTPDGAYFDDVTKTLKWDLIDRNLQPGETGNVLFSIRPKPGLASGTEIRNSAEIQFEIFEPLVTPEVANIIDSTLPSCTMDPLPADSLTPIALSWTGTDEIGEVDTYSVFVSTDGGPFTPFLTKTKDTSTTTFTGEVDKTYGFICIATDTAGNTEVQDPTAEAVTRVIATANLPPEAVCQDVTVPTGPRICTAKASVDAGSSDPDSDPITLVQAPPGPYPLGTSEVTLTVTDEGGLSDECTATVTVLDEEAPNLICPVPQTVQCAVPAGASVYFDPATTDNCMASPAVTCSPASGSTFPLGETVVTCTATDEAGNFATCDFSVTAEDTTPPVIFSITARPDVLWPPNHNMVPVAVTLDASDTCDSEPFCHIISVTSNEPENGLGDGDTAPDWEITGDLNVNLRAERSGSGSGRIYTITVECTDVSGNSGTDSTPVTVPHNK